MLYVDIFGHLFSDHSLVELYDFAVNGLGLKPEWNHFSRNFPHFDLTTKKKKDQALKMGAKFLDDTRHIIEFYNKVKSLYPSTIPHYLCKGLYNQPIMRVNFNEYFREMGIIAPKKK